MSTRGVIGVKTPTGWRGLYNHSDSYPEWLGKRIFGLLSDMSMEAYYTSEGGLMPKEKKKETMQAILRYFVKRYIDGHPAGWHSFPNMCYCHDRPEIFGIPPEQVSRDDTMTSDNPDPLSIEWIYLVDPEEMTLTILTAAHADYKEMGAPSPKAYADEKPYKDGWWEYPTICFCKHFVTKVINLYEYNATWQSWEFVREPDWKKVRKECDRAAMKAKKVDLLALKPAKAPRRRAKAALPQ